jgi:hypothetical protein
MRHFPLILLLVGTSALAAAPDAVIHVENAPGAPFGMPVAARLSAEDLARVTGGRYAQVRADEETLAISVWSGEREGWVMWRISLQWW